MTPFLTRRQLARRFKRAEWLVDGLSLAALTGYILYQYSGLVLNPGPATGGDTGSHFWALWSLVHHGIPSGTLRPWSPGNMGGEPILLHYFPFSFLLMWVLALFVPIGMAFNLGTMLWAVFFPISMYACLWGMGNRFPIPILGAAAGMLVLFNESYSMWGGESPLHARGPVCSRLCDRLFSARCGRARL